MPSLLQKLKDNFRRPGDILAFLSTGRRLLIAHRCKARLPVPELLARFSPPPGRPREPGRVEALERWVNWWLARRWFPVAHNCWTRSLVLFWLLRKHGIVDVGLRVGIEAESGNLLGHAWLVRNGEPILDHSGEDLTRYRVILEHPPAD